MHLQMHPGIHLHIDHQGKYHFVIQLLSHAWFFGNPWTVALQAPLSMGFPRQEYWSGLPFPPPRETSWPRGWTLISYTGRWILTTEPPGKAEYHESNFTNEETEAQRSLGMSYDQTASNQGSGDGTLYIPAPCPELLLSSLFTRCNLGAPGCPRGFYKSSPLVPTDLLTLDSSGSPIFSADKVVTGLIVHPAMLTTESSGNAPSRQREVAASFPNQATLVRTGREKRKRQQYSRGHLLCWLI